MRRKKKKLHRHIEKRFHKNTDTGSVGKESQWWQSAKKLYWQKWLAADSELLIFDEPTRGIDVGAKQEIYTLINHLVEQGKTVLMISSEMEELMGMSDRILILAEGNMTGELNKSEFNQERIMQLASIEKGE